MLTKHLTGKFRTKSSDDVAKDATRKLRAVLDERDATIRQLEQTIAEHESQMNSLRRDLEQADFRTQTLEQSYATQLGEARDRAETAECSVAEQQTRITELELGHKKLKRDLDDAKSRLDMFGPEAASIDEMLASFSIPKEKPTIPASETAAEEPLASHSNDEMLAPDVMFSGKRKVTHANIPILILSRDYQVLWVI